MLKTPLLALIYKHSWKILSNSMSQPYVDVIKLQLYHYRKSIQNEIKNNKNMKKHYLRAPTPCVNWININNNCIAYVNPLENSSNFQLECKCIIPPSSVKTSLQISHHRTMLLVVVYNVAVLKCYCTHALWSMIIQTLHLEMDNAYLQD